MKKSPETQKALADIAALKDVIIYSKTPSQLGIESINFYLLLHLVLISFVSLLCLSDVSAFLTGQVMSCAKIIDLRKDGVEFIGYTLLLLLAVGYGLTFALSLMWNKPFGDYMARYATYFKNFSALSDIFTKYCLLSLIILAGKPEWVAPVLALFVGDFVYQGKFFILKPAVSMILGLFSFVVAVVMFIQGYQVILVSLLLFGIICLLSLINILHFRYRLIVSK